MPAEHQCHGCPKREFGCRKTCESWKQYEAAHAQELQTRVDSRKRREESFSERDTMFKEYIRDKKLQPRSASNYF